MTAAAVASAAPREKAPRLDAILVGGGPWPDANQVSLEQDLAAAATLLPRQRVLLFAGGPGSQAVQVLDPNLRGDALVTALGALLDPRPDRDTRWRATTLHPDGPASPKALHAALRRALSESTATPLWLYVAAHGEQGERPLDNEVALWADERLSARKLIEWLDEAPGRPVVAIVTSCYSGGFAPLAFVGGSPGTGIAIGPRCALMATTDDELSSGCDPDPDRGAQHGFGKLFLEALAAQRKRDDFDGDGRVSPLEAHARARIESRSFDVPTTSSEAWLRAQGVDPDGAPGGVPHWRWPENDAVVQALSRALKVPPHVAVARRKLQALDRLLEKAEANADDAQQAEEAAYRRAAGRLLHRWPALADPWHPLFGPTLREHRAEIQRFMDRDPSVRAWRRARRHADAAADAADALRRRRGPLRRLVRALEDRVLADTIHSWGKPSWGDFLAILDCERTPLPPASPGK